MEIGFGLGLDNFRPENTMSDEMDNILLTQLLSHINKNLTFRNSPTLKTKNNILRQNNIVGSQNIKFLISDVPHQLAEPLSKYISQWTVPFSQY